MTDDGQRPPCSTADCEVPAAFWAYEPEPGRWRPICERHARRRHPSLEVGAWLESGYMTPVELGRPDGPPGEPRGARAAAFRAAVDEAMGWAD